MTVKPLEVIFFSSAMMHKYLDGLKELEIGSSSHNVFVLGILPRIVWDSLW